MAQCSIWIYIIYRVLPPVRHVEHNLLPFVHPLLSQVYY